jgi:1-acyl-sn-glycerol-3-phosphate acyltransferase
MDGSPQSVRAVRPVNRWFFIGVSLFIKPIVHSFFRLHPVGVEVVPRSGPGILVANHVNLFDPIWVYEVLKRPLYFVATEELFRGRFLATLVRLFGAFPIRKAAKDFQTVKNMVQVLRKGGLIGLYPEGSRSWDGTNEPLIPTIARLIRRLNVPVFYCRLEGGYLSFPRWADRFRRIPIRLVFGQLYRRGEIPDSERQILEDIAEAIRIRDYELPRPDPKHHFTGLASGIGKILYRCPNCQTMEGLSAVQPLGSNLVECRSCFSMWRVDIRSRLTPVDESGRAAGEGVTVAELHRQIKQMPVHPIYSSLIHLEPGEELYLVSRPHFLFRERRFPRLRLHGFGRAFLTNQRLLFRGRWRRRGRVRVSVPLEAIEALSVEPGDKLHFVYRGLLYRIPFRRESPVKWFDLLKRLTESPSRELLTVSR